MKNTKIRKRKNTAQLNQPFFSGKGNAHLDKQQFFFEKPKNPILRYGSKGIKVQYLQEQLNQHGTNLIVDGKFGSKTQQAVRHFQAANAPPVDGIVGPITWEALKRNTNSDKEVKKTDIAYFSDLEGLFDNLRSKNLHHLSFTSFKQMLLETKDHPSVNPSSTKQPNNFDHVQQGEELSASIAKLHKSWHYIQNNPYPVKNGAPKNIKEVYDRLNAFRTHNKPLPLKEKKWLYAALQAVGVYHALAAGQAFQNTNLAPVRSKIVTLALGQIGLVEAKVDSGIDRIVGKSKVDLREGGDRLMEYITRAAPKAVEDPQAELKKRKILDVKAHIGPNVKYVDGPDGKKKMVILPGHQDVPSWCGILALWIQNTAGNDGGYWNNARPKWTETINSDKKHEFMPATETPKPGDISYMIDKSHHGTVIRVEGTGQNATIITVEGNLGNNSIIALRSRKRSDWQGFVRAVEKGKG